MAGMSRIDLDVAGGLLIEPPVQEFCFCEGFKIAILGQKVTNHGWHLNETMVEASTFCFVNGIGIVQTGDKASCNHTATGSEFCFCD